MALANDTRALALAAKNCALATPDRVLRAVLLRAAKTAERVAAEPSASFVAVVTTVMSMPRGAQVIYPKDAAQIVHDHFGPTGGQRQRMLLAQAAACACDDRHAAFEIDAHESSL